MTENQKKAFLAAYGVTHETIHRLTAYEGLLIEWNKKFNLIAESTIPHIWSRHFADSAQLLPYIPQNAKTLADIGSGAGFPGLVLAVLAAEKAERQGLRLTLIESIRKKADFLSHVIRELGLSNVVVRNERVEDIKDLKADILTARAVKALPELLKYAHYLSKKETVCAFLKGKNLAGELTDARKCWTFAADIHPSQTDDLGRIAVLSNLSYKTWKRG